MKKTIMLALLAITSTLAISGCNTVRGVGQDLQSVANDVDEAT